MVVRVVAVVAAVRAIPVHNRIASLPQLGRGHPLLLLPPVAEPDSHHFLLQLQGVCEAGDFLGGGLGILVEVLLQGTLDRDLDAGPLLPLPALGRDLVYGRGSPRRGVCLRQPLLEQRHQLAHVLEAELECLEATDSGLGEDVAVEGAESQTHVRLGEAELDASLLELFRKGLQVV